MNRFAAEHCGTVRCHDIGTQLSIYDERRQAMNECPRRRQEIVIRLGRVSWLLIGAGIAALSEAALASSVRSRLVRLILVPSGVVVGLWPLVAWVGGAFRPGPFTSGLWPVTAIGTASWFLVAAVALIRKQPTQAP